MATIAALLGVLLGMPSTAFANVANPSMHAPTYTYEGAYRSAHVWPLHR